MERLRGDSSRIDSEPVVLGDTAHDLCACLDAGDWGPGRFEGAGNAASSTPGANMEDVYGEHD